MKDSTNTESDSSDGKQQKNTLKRRNFLKRSGFSAFAAGTLITSTASASSGNEQSKFEILVREVSSQEVNLALESSVVHRLINTERNLQLNRKNAKKRIILANDSIIGETIRIPTEIGNLDIILEGSQPAQATISLQRNHLHNSTLARIESILDWPVETKGYLKSNRTENGVRFARTVSGNEDSKLRRVAELDSRVASMGVEYPLPGTSRNRPTVTYYAAQGSKYFVIDSSLENVVEQRSFNPQGPSIMLTKCQSMAGACLGDILMAFPGCGVSFAACGLTGPVTVACVVAVLAICGPNAGLVAVSGNCSYIANNCL